jgi:hypothetical protein
MKGLVRHPHQTHELVVKLSDGLLMRRARLSPSRLHVSQEKRPHGGRNRAVEAQASILEAHFDVRENGQFVPDRSFDLL